MVAWNTMLARAEAALQRRAYADAERDAEALLQAPIPRDTRGRALLVAADAAYHRRAYPNARDRFGVFVAEYPNAPDAARAAMALGWARLRSGDRLGARATWTELADARPRDPRAPVALLLSAEIADQSADPKGAESLVNRLISQYPSSSTVPLARLRRGTALLQRGQDAAALSDLGWVLAVTGPAILDQRRTLTDAMTIDGSESVLEGLTSAHAAARVDNGEALERLAARLLDPQHHEKTPYLLHGAALLAAQRSWAHPTTVALASRLVERFPSYPPAPLLLRRVAEAATTSQQWALAQRAWETLLAHTPAAVGRAERVTLAEAQWRSGQTTQARQGLEAVVATGSAETPRALLLLAQLHLAAGETRNALAAYDRLQKDYPRTPRSAKSLLEHAALLEDLGDHQRARPLLQQVVAMSQGEAVAEAAYRLGRGLSTERQHAAAVEWYLTAAYVAEPSRWGRQALLEAGRALTTLDERRDALAVYWKLITARPGPESTDERALRGEAAYEAGAILRGASLHAEALQMFETSARLTAGLPTERRALQAALQCATESRNRKAAEVLHRRLEQVGSRPSPSPPVRQVLGSADRVSGGPAAESALPAAAR